MLSMKGYITKMQKVNNKNNGFTIIEVVLVLAIAGLIFLMVFIALPALQRSQRDTARKNDVSIVSAAVTSFSSNNKGAFPTSGQIQGYATNVSDNTVPDQIYVRSSTAPFKPEDGSIYITPKTVCGVSTDSQALSTGTIRQYTVVTKIEAAGGTAYCLDN